MTVTQDFTQPTVFEKLLEPVNNFVLDQDSKLFKHHNQKFGYYAFFKILMYFFIAGEKSLKLFIETKLKNGLLPESLGLQKVAYTTCYEAFERFSVALFQDVFKHLLTRFSFKQVPELASLGRFYCIDGSIFPVISSMLWAEYTSKSQALKLHLCFELNRMIPTTFLVTSANSSERNALLNMLEAGVTYIGDRGYMSFKLCHELVQNQAHFVFRVKKNLVYTVKETLIPQCPDAVFTAVEKITDELTTYTNDDFMETYRLVSFTIMDKTFKILTDRRDLTTFQIIMLYGYRWQIELLFRFIKRTMNGIHLIRNDKTGVTIQFYALIISALLLLIFKQNRFDEEESPQSVSYQKGVLEDFVSNNKPNSKENGILKRIGKSLKKYWKITIHWLVALRSLLSAPSDKRISEILNSV